MVGLKLAVEQGEAAQFQPRHEPGKRHFGGVGRATDHAFAKKGAAKRKAIETAHEQVAVPAFDGMSIAKGMEFTEDPLYTAVDPGIGPVAGGVGAEPDDVGERGIRRHPETVRCDPLAQ